MPVTSDSLLVSDTPVALSLSRKVGGSRITIKNAGTGNRVADLGPVDVVFGEGFELKAGESVVVALQSGEMLYAVSNVEGTTLKILRT